MMKFCIIVYIVDQKNKEYFLKIFRKKISYEGLTDIYKSRTRFIGKRAGKERKRVKKHTFRRHISNMIGGYFIK